MNATELTELLPNEVIDDLRQAVGLLSEVANRADALSDACSLLDTTLGIAESAIVGEPPASAIPTLAKVLAGTSIGVVGVAVVAIVGLALGGNVTINVRNVNCGTIDLAMAQSAARLIPGVSLPGSIPESDSPASMKFPALVVGELTLRQPEGQRATVNVRIVGQALSAELGTLDLDGSTWDGQSLRSLLDRPISLGEEHTLNLVCGG